MATIDNGEIDGLTQQEIRDLLEDALLDEGDYRTEGGAIGAILTALSSVLAEHQEQGLVDVYRNAFLETATGESLANVVSILGLQRQSAVHATGSVTFDADSQVDSTVNIANGTTVETSTGVAFDTTEAVEIPYWDGFEDANALDDYSGDTGSFEVSSAQAETGSNSLHATSSGTVWLDDGFSSRGMTHHAHVYFDSSDGGAQIATWRYITESANLSAGYSIQIDADTNELNIGTTTDSVTIPSDEWLELEVYPDMTGTHTISLYDSTDTELTTFTHDEFSGSYPDPSSDHEGTIAFGANSSAVYWDEAAASRTAADIRAVEAGPSGNVGRQAITTMPSPVSGVNDVYNTQAVGDEDLFDTDGEQMVAGTPEETDAELRNRARRVSGAGGAASIDALLGSILDVDGVTSVQLYENDTDTDNTGTGGLPPVSFELVVGGGSDTDVAEAIYEERAATARDYGGANGTAVSVSVEAVNGQNFTMDFSRPTVIDVDPTLDIVVSDEYAGDRAVRRAVTNYIGGVGVDGESVQGLAAGENVIINELEARIHGVEGVIGVDSSDSSYTPSTTTDGNGLEVIDIGDNEVAETDASDGSISISKTEI